MKNIALALSYIAHPIFIPTLLLALVFFAPIGYVYYTISTSGKLFLLSASFVLTVLAPALTVFYLLHSKQIKSVHMDSRHERILPFTVGLAYNMGMYYVLKQFGISPIISKVLIVSILGITISVVVTLVWKISAHMIGLAALQGVYYAYGLMQNHLSVPIMVGMFVFVGLVGAARLYLRAHVPSQVYAGWILGFAIGAGVLLW